MPSPLDWIRKQIAASIDTGPLPAIPPAPAPTPRAAQATAPLRLAVRDDRDVAPGARLAGHYQQEPMADVIRQAGAAGVPPTTALAMAIRENSTDLANPGITSSPGTRNPLSLVQPPTWAAGEPNQVEAAMLHAVERASAVAPAGRERQIQAYQGLGKQPAGYNERFVGQANPYAKAVEEIDTRVVQRSPQLLALLRSVKPLPLDPSKLSYEKLLAIGESLTRRARHPGLWK